MDSIQSGSSPMRFPWLEVLYDTVKTAARSLVRSPFYSGVAITILTLGLATSTTVITYINSSYSPIPGIDTDCLVQIYGVEQDDPYTSISYLDYVDYAAARSFEGLAATQISTALLPMRRAVRVNPMMSLRNE